jgi:hypothetical protein
MALTVPTSGLAGGRAANVQVAEFRPGTPPDTGATISRLGDAMLQIGTGLENDRLSREAQRLDIDMTRDLFRMRQEFEQTNDPDAIDRDWPARLAQLKQQYLTGVADNGAPRVDRKNRERFDLAFTSLADRHAMELGARAITLRQAVDVAQGAEMRNELVVQGAVVGDEVLPELIARGEAWIDGQAAKYGTDAATVQTQKAEFRASIYSQRADTMIANDPAGFLTAAEAGTFNSLGEDLTAKKLAAQAQLNQNAAREQKAAEVAIKEAAAARDDRIKTVIDIFAQGRTPADAAYLETPEAKESPLWAQGKAAAALDAEFPDLRLMTPEQLDEQIAREEARPITEPWENERLTVLRGWREQAASGWNTTPVETAREAGLPVPEMRAFDPAQPEAFAEDLSRAVRFQNDVLHEWNYTKAPAVFDKDTQTQLTAVLAPDADPAAKLSLLSAIVQGAGADRDAVLDQLGVKPEVKRAAYLLATSPAAYQGLVQDALAGQQKLALKTVQVPSERVAGVMFDEVTGGALAGMPEPKRRQIIDLANALYASQAAGIDPDAPEGTLTTFLQDPARVTLYQEAVRRATGALAGDVGGVQQVRVGTTGAPREYQVALPAGQPAAPVSGALTALQLSLQGLTRDEARSRNVYVAGGDAPSAFAMTALQKASIDGRVPDFGPDPAEYFKGLRIQRIGDSDVYRFVDVSAGRPQIVGDADGREYRFKLPDLIRHTKGGPK